MFIGKFIISGGNEICCQTVLLVVKDSYANSFVPFVAKQFKKIIVIDLRYFKGDVQSLVKENAVSDVLTLYGINTLMNDNNLKKLNKKLIGAI